MVRASKVTQRVKKFGSVKRSYWIRIQRFSWFVFFSKIRKGEERRLVFRESKVTQKVKKGGLVKRSCWIWSRRVEIDVFKLR